MIGDLRIQLARTEDKVTDQWRDCYISVRPKPQWYQAYEFYRRGGNNFCMGPMGVAPGIPFPKGGRSRARDEAGRGPEGPGGTHVFGADKVRWLYNAGTCDGLRLAGRGQQFPLLCILAIGKIDLCRANW